MRTSLRGYGDRPQSDGFIRFANHLIDQFQRGLRIFFRHGYSQLNQRISVTHVTGQLACSFIIAKRGQRLDFIVRRGNGIDQCRISRFLDDIAQGQSRYNG
jgi:hypothetical protein